MGGGTEQGSHCQHSECNHLDFSPFECDGCHKVFCLDHRSYQSHECPIVCEISSTVIETTGKDDVLERHDKSGDCDPSKKKKKPKCSVSRCRKILTSTCKICELKFCFAHRYPSDHACSGSDINGGGSNSKFMDALAERSDKDCVLEEDGSASTFASSSPPSVPVKAC